MENNIVLDKAKELEKIIALTIEDPSKSKELKIKIIITLSSAVCAIVAVQPIPFADAFILTPIQLIMVRYLGSVHGLNYSENRLQNILTQLLAVVGWGILIQQVILGLYKTILPFLGGVTTIPLVFIATYGLGYTMNAYLKSQAEGKQLTNTELKRIKQEVENEVKKTNQKINLAEVKKLLLNASKEANKFEQYKNLYKNNQLKLTKNIFDDNDITIRQQKNRYHNCTLVTIEDYVYHQLVYFTWDEIIQFEEYLFHIFNNSSIKEFGERIPETCCYMMPLVKEKIIYFTRESNKTHIHFIGTEKNYLDDLEKLKLDFERNEILYKKSFKDKEIRIRVLEIIKEAKQEIDIIAPWISWTIANDNEFIQVMKEVLNRGVIIKILTGLGGNSSYQSDKEKRKKTEKYASQWTNDTFKSYKDRFFIRFENTHVKLLLCDEKYHMSGSYNILSFDGRYDGTDTRGENMDIQHDRDLIIEKRNIYFNF